MTGTVSDVLHQAALEVGYGESPAGSNRTKFAGEAGHPNGQAWCATFVSALMKRCHVNVPAGVLVPSSRTMYATAKQLGLSVPMSAVRAGDVVHMTRGAARAWLGHVAIVEAVGPDGVHTIEGNTNGKGSATGGSVLRHVRPYSAWNLGAWRPRYTQERRDLLLLPDGHIVAWRGEVVDGRRVVTHVGTIPEVEAMLRGGWVQYPYAGPVFYP